MQLKKTIFLDRDGVINRERGEYTYLKKYFEINKNIISALLNFQKKGYQLIVISNQGGVAKNIYTKQNIIDLHNYMIKKLAINGVILTAVFFCPHHQNYGNCLCRKPKALLLEKAIAKYKVDSSQSFFIGDSQRDVDAAKRVKVKGILIESNSSLLNLNLS